MKTRYREILDSLFEEPTASQFAAAKASLTKKLSVRPSASSIVPSLTRKMGAQAQIKSQYKGPSDRVAAMKKAAPYRQAAITHKIAAAQSSISKKIDATRSRVMSKSVSGSVNSGSGASTSVKIKPVTGSGPGRSPSGPVANKPPVPRPNPRRTVPQTTPVKKPNQSEFGAAFAAARQSGKKTFMFKGKSYTTKLKKR